MQRFQKNFSATDLSILRKLFQKTSMHESKKQSEPSEKAKRSAHGKMII